MTVIVLTTLTFFYRQITTLNVQAEIQQKEGFKMRYIENRFSQIFPSAINAKKKGKNFFFFTVSDQGGIFAQSSPISLIFSYDNGVDLSKPFSNKVVSRIFLDAKGRLCMATWPIPSRWQAGVTLPMKFEVLLEEVESLKFGFFVAPDKKWQMDKTGPTPNPAPNQPNPVPTATTTVTINPSPEGAWINEWSQDFKQLPAMIKVEVARKGKVDYFVFPLSRCNRQPVYNQ